MTTLDEVVARLRRLEDASGLFASDQTLGGEYGDKPLRCAPRDAPHAKGMRPSELSPEDLDACVSFLTWQAGKDRKAAENPPEGKTRADLLKYAGYSRRDAAICRAWARRKREGGASSAPAGVRTASAARAVAPSFDEDDGGADEIHF